MSTPAPTTAPTDGPTAGPTAAPTVWSLVSSIGLIYFIPQLVLLLVAIVGGSSFGIGLPELSLVLAIYVVGIPWVVLRWIARRGQSARPAAA